MGNWVYRLYFILLVAFGVVVLTETGEEWAVDKLNEAVQTKAEYIAWGTGAVAPTKPGTGISTPAAEARVLGTSSKTGTLATAKLQVVGTLTSASAQTITNAGLFTAVTAGSLIVWGDHTGVALAINDQIQYTFTLDPA